MSGEGKVEEFKDIIVLMFCNFYFQVAEFEDGG